METRSKARTFIGFAIKAGHMRFGMNSVNSLKRAALILCCKSAAENTAKEAVSAAKKFGCPLLITKDAPLSDMVHRENVKAAAITDRRLARAVFDNAEEEFTVGN